jgi:hypothetical protein
MSRATVAAECLTLWMRYRYGCRMNTPATTPTESAKKPLRPGTMVYDVLGDPENDEDTGIIFSVQDGGYSVIWTGDMTGKFAAADEVAVLPPTRMTPALAAALEAIDEREYRSCQSHCCRRHGCKYAEPNCPVTKGRVTQDHPCEQCTDSLDDASRWSGQPYPARGEVGFDFVLGFSREDESMTDMPTHAQVTAAVEQALSTLTVNGWTLTRVVGDTDTDGDADDDGDDDE